MPTGQTSLNFFVSFGDTVSDSFIMSFISNMTLMISVSNGSKNQKDIPHSRDNKYLFENKHYS